jgi:FkbM family methyltransferase
MSDFPYYQNRRIRIANFFRRFFRYPIAERVIIFLFPRLTAVKKLVPPEYLYRPKSYRIATRDGVVYRFDLSNVIDHSLYFFHRYFTPLQLFLLVKPDTIMVDIGANIGTVALHVAATAKHGKVFAFEPDSHNYDLLQKNVALNNFKNVIPIQKALGERPAQSKLFKVNRFNNGMNRILPDNTAFSDFENVEVSTLDKEAALLKLERIDLIKIDVEGYELNVLKGASNVLKQFHPLLVVEVVEVNLNNHGHSSLDVIELLRTFGYQFIDLKTGKPLIEERHLETDILCYTTSNPLA